MIERPGLLIILLVLCSCIEFRISDKEALEQLNESNQQIEFGDLMIGDRNMHYVYTDQGKDLLVVFVHGSPGSWNAFIDYFKADSILKDIDMLSVDRPGFGNSGFGVAQPSLEMQAKQIKAVTDQFPHKKKILIGHSLGGPIIARMAMNFPNSFDGLIMVAPSIDPKMEKEEWYRKVIDTQMGSLVTSKEFDVSNEEILPLKTELEKMIPLWKNIKIPCIIIQGTADQLVPKENADFAKKVLPSSLVEVRMLEGVNHFIPWNQPTEIIKAIMDLASRF